MYVQLGSMAATRAREAREEKRRPSIAVVIVGWTDEYALLPESSGLYTPEDSYKGHCLTFFLKRRTNCYYMCFAAK